MNTSHYQCKGYGICFDGKGKFTIGNITNGKNVLIFGCDMSFSIHANNKLNNIYVLGESITLLCLGNISSDWSVTNATKAGLYGNVYDFAADYVPISGVKIILDMRRYLMTKHNILNA